MTGERATARWTLAVRRRSAKCDAVIIPKRCCCPCRDCRRVQRGSNLRLRDSLGYQEGLNMDLAIRGLRVLVTAGASGIGLATARAFAREGARVHVCDVDEASLKSVAASDPAIVQSVCDVADGKAIARMFDQVTAAFGGLDALVNNAGIAGPTAACEDIALADWERTLAVNLTGQFLCAQRAIPWLRKSSNPSIVNLSSAAGRFGFPGRTPYAASKWGVIGL